MTHQERIEYLTSTSETIAAQLNELIALRKQIKAQQLSSAHLPVTESFVSLIPDDGPALARQCLALETI
jgi:hypothetical protein